MEKKKGLIVVITIIVILALVASLFAVYSYMSSKEEKIKENKNKEIKNEVSQNVIEESENNNEVELSNEIDNEDDEIIEELGISNREKEELEEKALEIINAYMPISYYEADNLGAMPYILVQLELIDAEQLNEQLLFGEEYTKQHIKTSVKYDDFKKAMLNYITEEYFDKYFCLYKNMDGYVGVNNTAAGLGASEAEEIELIKVNNGDYEFEVKLKDVETYEHFVSGDSYVKEGDWTFYDEVTFKYVNGKFVISKYSEYVPYLNGNYAYDASDVGYEFFIDGTVEYSSNMAEEKGTYKKTGPDTFEITFTERIIWEEDYENTYLDENGYEIVPHKEVKSEINEKQTITIVDEEKLIIEYKVDGENHKGEIIKFER